MATLNLWGEFADWPTRCALLADGWPQVDADILLVQECRAHAALDQAMDVAHALGLPHVHGLLATDVEGIAIISRLPLEPLALAPLPPSDPRREAVAARVDAPGLGMLTVACAHVAFRPVRTQRSQIQALGAMFDGPVVLGGDFNATPDAVAPHLPGYADTLPPDVDTWPMITPRAFRRAWREHVGRTPRFPLDRRRLDYLFVRDCTAHAAGARVIGPESAPASDHALVWADIGC